MEVKLQSIQKATDPSFQTEATKRFYADKKAQLALSKTIKLSTV